MYTKAKHGNKTCFDLSKSGKLRNRNFVENLKHGKKLKILCTKGQIKPKAGLARRRFSQKTNEEFDLFDVKSMKKQTKHICSFVFWENLQRANLLSVLSDL